MLNKINITYEKRKNNSKNKKSTQSKNKSKTKLTNKKSDKLNYNITVTKKTPTSNNLSLNNNNIINNININGDFLSLSNNILYLIKEHFHNNKLYISNIKLISESINEQTLFSRSATNDILLYLNQIVKPRYNGTMANMNEKYIKDKLYQINLRMEKINDLKNSMLQNIRSNETSLISFYEEINNLLSMLKIVLSKKGENQKNSNKLNLISLIDYKNNKIDIESYNNKEYKNEELINNINNTNKNKKLESIDLESMKDKYLQLYQNQKSKIKKDINIDSSDKDLRTNLDLLNGNNNLNSNKNNEEINPFNEDGEE